MPNQTGLNSISEKNVNLRDDNGQTALHRAVMAYDFRKVRLLLEEEANVDLADKNGYTVLHLAVMRSTELVKVLLEKGANINLIDKKASRPCIMRFYSRLS